MTKTTAQPLYIQALTPIVVPETFDRVARLTKSEYLLLLLTATAVALPLMWAYQTPPLPAFFSQWLAGLLWSVVAVVALATGAFAALQTSNSNDSGDGARTPPRPISPSLRWYWLILFMWGLLVILVLAHAAFAQTPAFIALPALFNMSLAGLITASVMTRRADPQFLSIWLSAFLTGVLVAALFNAGVALVQLVAPLWTNETWIASIASEPNGAPSQGGYRASGNLRQPNQLATLTIWGLLAATRLLRRHVALWLAVSLPLLATLFATGSRVGVISLGLIAGVALMRSKRVRAGPRTAWITAAVIALVLVWFAASAFTRATAEPALTQRLALWRDVCTLIAHAPWIGVGWGQLNFVWTLTPLPARAPNVFDHAHSLPLQLAVELGIPAATGILLLLALALWRTRRLARSREGATVLLMLAAIVLHSLFEYPLWFAYFLLPSAFLLAGLGGTGLAQQNLSGVIEVAYDARASGTTILTTALAALIATACIAMSIYGWKEYRKISAIYGNSTNINALRNTVSEAQKSLLYGQFGDYAAIMIAGELAELAWFDRPILQVLDERLLTAYAQALARAGEFHKAAYVVARAREFPPQAVFAGLPIIAPTAANSPANLTSRDFRR